MHFSIKIYMVCSYSFKLSQKTVPTTFILNYYHMSSYLRAIEYVIFLIYLMHFATEIFMVCSKLLFLSQKTVPTTFILNYYHICRLTRILELKEKAYPDIKAK